MNSDHKSKTTTLLAVLIILAICVTGCGGAGQASKRGMRADLSKNYDTAVTEYKIALDKEHSNIEYQLKYETARYNSAFMHFEAGRRALDKEDYETAKAEFARTVEIDPTHVLAQQSLDKVNAI